MTVDIVIGVARGANEKKYQSKYYKDNKERTEKQRAEYRKRIVDEKRFYCETCDITCMSDAALKNHFETLKHKFVKDPVKQRAEYYKNNREKILQHRKAYFKRNVEEKRFYCETCNVTYMSSSKLKRHFESLKHKKNNKRSRKEYMAKYYKNNREKILKQQAAYCENNKEKVSK